MNEENLSNTIVVKRDGKKVSFDGTKIAIAIKKGFDSVENESDEKKYTEEDINNVYNNVINKIIELKKDRVKIEEIQDFIEEELKKSDYQDVYKSFSEYRENRAQSREIFFDEKRKHKFLKALEKLGLKTKENAEVILDNKNAMQTMSAYGSTVSAEFATSYLIKKKFSECHENGDIYIHNIDYYPMGTTESMQINIEKLFENGFSTESSSIREPQNILTYSVLSTIAISGNQKDQDGQQGIPAFDYYMAKGVLKTFKKQFRQTIYDILEYTDYDKFIAINGIEREIEKLYKIDFDIEEFYKFTRGAEELKRMFRIAYKNAMEKTNNLVYQAMEAFVHNLNSLCTENINSKYTTINLGTDTSAEGRMITKNLLKCIEEGIGNNKNTMIPVTIFKVKKGINYDKQDKNYDLLVEACKLIEENKNIYFNFLDTTYNSQKYKEGDFSTEVAYLENGTRIIENVLDEEKEIVPGRGVLSTTTINLPRIALKHKNSIEDFFSELEQKMDLVKDQLLERLEIQGNKKVFNFPFLMKQNVWIDSEKLKEEDKVKKILKQGIMKISFLGLNECLIVLKEKNHGESKAAQELGLQIVEIMRKKTDEFSRKYNLNFMLAGENDMRIAKEFIEVDRVIFGKVENVTNKEHYTASFELPKNYDLDKKIKIEAPYHELTNGGHMIEVETNESVLNAVNKMFGKEIGLAKINFYN